MSRIRSPITCLAACTLVLTLAASHAAANVNWLTDYQAALNQARQSGKPVMIYFTGSDWCGWCMRLKREVFDTEPFAKWVRENVVPLELDFPRRQQQPERLRQQNRQLQQRYGVRGFPTVLFVDATGEPFGRSGYMEGGPEAWLRHANQQLANQPEPPTLELAESFSAALQQAEEKGRPLIIVAEPGTHAGLARRIEALFEHTAFIEMANNRAVTVHIQREGDEAAGEQELEKIDELFEALGVRSNPLQVAVISFEEDEPKLLMQARAIADPRQMTAQVQRTLPEPKYEGGWTEDYELARQAAAATGRPMLLNFTGSDWCPPCQAMERDVLGQQEFKQWARDRVVLVTLDFPRQKQQDAQVQRRNRQLQQQFQIRGFPTFILVDAEGNEIHRVSGYQRGGVEGFTAMLQRHIEGE